MWISMLMVHIVFVIAEVVAVDVTSSTGAGMVTVGVADLANAGMAFPADTAGVVTVCVASLADAGIVTVGVPGRCWGGVPDRTCWGGHRSRGFPGRCWDGHRRSG